MTPSALTFNEQETGRTDPSVNSDVTSGRMYERTLGNSGGSRRSRMRNS